MPSHILWVVGVVNIKRFTIFMIIMFAILMIMGSASAWWDLGYANRIYINDSNVTSSDMPFQINGSNGFTINGVRQYVWITRNNGEAKYLYYTSDSSYAVGNETAGIPFDVSKGNVTSSNKAQVYYGSNTIVGVWHFDDTTNLNDTFNRNKATFVGGANIYNSSTCPFGGSCLAVPRAGSSWVNSTTVGFPINASLRTLSCFIYQAAKVNYNVPFEYGTSAANKMWGFYNGATGNIFKHGWGAGDDDSGQAVTLTTWYMLTLNGTGTARTAIFGETTSDYDAPSLNTGDYNMAFGTGANTDSGSYFDGYIDECILMNRSITSEELKQRNQNRLNGTGYGLLGASEAAPSATATVSQVLLRPLNPNTTSLLLCNATILGTNGTYYVEYNFTNASSTLSYGNRTGIANNTNSFIANKTSPHNAGDNVTCRIRASPDMSVWSDWLSTSLTIIETTPPTVTIQAPTNKIGIVAASVPYNGSLNYTATDNTIRDKCWFNTGGANTTITSCQNTTYSVTEYKNYTITVFSNDTFGNIGSATTNISIGKITSNLSSFSGVKSTFQVAITELDLSEESYATCRIANNDSSTMTCDSSYSYGAVNLNCTPTGSIEKKVDIWIYCNNTQGYKFNTTKQSIWVDTISPIFAESRFDKSGKSVWASNLTGQFNITDSNIFRVNITIDGVSIRDVVNINATVWNYTLNRDVSNLSVGSHIFKVEAYDAHTAAAIPEYDVSKNLFSNAVRFDTASNSIQIKALDEGFTVTNPWETTKLTDRYTFDYNPTDTKQTSYNFEVETDQELFIVVKPDQKWHTWIVSGNNWIDFYQESDPKLIPKITQTAKNRALVEITAPATLDKAISFSSVGDLNYAQVNFTFYRYNLTTSFVNPVDENNLQSVYLTYINSTTESYSVGFYFNSSSYFPISHTTNGTNITINVTFLTPMINATAIVTNQWQFNISGETYNLYFNQTVMRSALDDCSVYNATSLRFNIRHEDSPTVAINGSLEFMITYWQTDKALAKIYSSQKNNSNIYSVCMVNGSQTYNVDIYALDTTPSGFAHRYYLFNSTINGTVQDIYLYNFNYTSGISDLKLTVRDYLTNKYKQGYVVTLQRLYLGEGVWRSVQMDMTDDYGLVIFNVLEQLEDYRLVFMDNNNTVFKTTNTMKFQCTSGLCELTYPLDTSQAAAASNTVTISWAYTTATNSLNMTWTDPLGGTNEVNTSLVKYTYTGTTSLCNQSQSGASGSVNCPTSGYTGQAFFKVVANGNLVVSQWVELNTSKMGDQLDEKEGAWWAAIIVLTCAMFGLMSPAVGVIAMVIGLIAVFMLGIFTPLTMTLLVVAVIVAIAIGWKVRS